MVVLDESQGSREVGHAASMDTNFIEICSLKFLLQILVLLKMLSKDRFIFSKSFLI